MIGAPGSRSPHARRAVCALVVVTALGGCSWFPRFAWFAKKPQAVDAPARSAEAAPPVDVRPAAEAQAACPNYAQAFRDSSFPRGAIIRGIDSGRATVRFVVDGDTVTIVSISSSDPDFGDAAVGIVRRYTCHTDKPTTFEMPFDWRTGR